VVGWARINDTRLLVRGPLQCLSLALTGVSSPPSGLRNPVSERAKAEISPLRQNARYRACDSPERV